ncbi:MAG: hypothetical protein Q4G21_04240 [Dermabacter sp.]|nr:hypothetical protein [Dermabacter sp.]
MRATSSAPVRAAAYPVTVSLPGVLEAGSVAKDTYGFPPPPKRESSPRWRRALTWIAALVGLVIAAATIVLFVWLYQYATSSLPSPAAASVLSLPHAAAGAIGSTPGG